MACCRLPGRRAGEIAACRRCRKTLALLQGIEPSRETEALYQKIALPKKS